MSTRCLVGQLLGETFKSEKSECPIVLTRTLLVAFSLNLSFIERGVIYENKRSSQLLLLSEGS